MRAAALDRLDDDAARKPRAAKMVAPPQIAIKAARLRRLRPDAADVIEQLLDTLLAEVVRPFER